MVQAESLLREMGVSAVPSPPMEKQPRQPVPGFAQAGCTQGVAAGTTQALHKLLLRAICPASCRNCFQGCDAPCFSTSFSLERCFLPSSHCQPLYYPLNLCCLSTSNRAFSCFVRGLEDKSLGGCSCFPGGQ